MRYTYLLLLVLLLTFAQSAIAAPARILFIGNSYTGVNNLPGIFKNIVASTSDPVPTIESIHPGGKTLEQHLNLPATQKLIDRGNWDVVVIQGQSQEAAMSEQFANMRTSFLKGAAGLYERIKAKSPKAQVVFYETWARHADYWKKPNANKNVGDDPAEMQKYIRKWYQQAAADKKDCVVAPVGDAWELNYQSKTPLRLHAKDHSHPDFAGSYLAALVIYATIYHPSDLEITYHGRVNDTDAAYLQRLARQMTGPATR